MFQETAPHCGAEHAVEQENGLHSRCQQVIQIRNGRRSRIIYIGTTGTREAVRSTIFDFLYVDKTGLPDSYSDEEIKAKSEDVFRHVFYAYPTIPSAIFDEPVVARA